MKQANLFSFFKKSADPNTTTTAAAPPVVPAASNNPKKAKASVPREEKVDNRQQQQPLEALPTVQAAVEEVQPQPEIEAEINHTIIEDESKEQPPPIIPPSLGRSGSNSSSSSSSSSSASAIGGSTGSVLANGGNQMSDYERVREENIRRNQAFLMSLGLAGPDTIKPMGSTQSTARPGKHVLSYPHLSLLFSTL